MLTIVLVNASIVLVLLTVLWFVSLLDGRVGVIDAAWGPGFVVIAWSTWIGFSPRQMHWVSLLLLAASTLWGMRLGIHLLIRFLPKPEDRRYQAMRDKRGPSFRFTSLFIVFWFQAVVMLIVAFPIQSGLSAAQTRSPMFAIGGAAVWLLGFLFEAVGDYQLSRFRSDPASQGRVLNVGLWRYTRHPNYFGDFLIWWGMFLIAISAGAAWWTAIGPVIMSVFLMKYSGVGMLEKDIGERRPKYADYMRRTNAFFPWFPKSASETE